MVKENKIRLKTFTFFEDLKFKQTLQLAKKKLTTEKTEYLFKSI